MQNVVHLQLLLFPLLFQDSTGEAEIAFIGGTGCADIARKCILLYLIV